jgi:hypothetical protein
LALTDRLISTETKTKTHIETKSLVKTDTETESFRSLVNTCSAWLGTYAFEQLNNIFPALCNTEQPSYFWGIINKIEPHKIYDFW